MNATTVESTAAQKAAYGGLIDSLGGIAVAVLAILGLTGFDPLGMAAIATIVFGAALLAQGGTILFEYSTILSTTSSSVSAERAGAEGLSTLFLVGAAGIVLGILALLGIASEALISAAAITFGSGLVLSSGVVRQLSLLQSEMVPRAFPRSGNEMFVGQMAAGSAGFQAFAGLATIVLGTISVAAEAPMTGLKLVALLLLGVTVLFTGGTLSGLVLSFVRPSREGGPRLQRGSM
jgi:hypothetical protein